MPIEVTSPDLQPDLGQRLGDLFPDDPTIVARLVALQGTPGRIEPESLQRLISSAESFPGSYNPYRGVLYMLAILAAQGEAGWQSFQTITGLLSFGKPGDGFHTNCANAVSTSLHFGARLPQNKRGRIPWFIMTGGRVPLGNPQWRTAGSLKNALENAAWFIDERYQVISFHPIEEKTFVFTGNSRKTQPFDRTEMLNTLRPGDLVFWAAQHVAMIVGFGGAETQDAEGNVRPFYLRYRDALEEAARRLNVDRSAERTDGELEKELRRADSEIVLWVADHSYPGSKQPITHPRPITGMRVFNFSGEIKEVQYVRVDYTDPPQG
ncbi:MAG: hypothetical protein GYB66_05210 [Chloroflexi bacterium]|nr:hypothetical protein [Chloroflexota bacterium]